MTKDEFTRICRMGQWPSFFRLADGLRAIKIDFDYAKTRKLLDPKWDGYNIGNMDIEDDDVPLDKANLLTSQHRDSDLHRVVLDLDYGACTAQTPIGYMMVLGRTEMVLGRRVPLLSNAAEGRLINTLAEYQIASSIKWQQTGDLVLHTNRDIALVPSSTRGHHHLIMALDMPWDKYIDLLSQLAAAGVIEDGYAKGAKARGFSGIRPPWVHK
jgi:hypothetical protein